VKPGINLLSQLNIPRTHSLSLHLVLGVCLLLF